ncbi:MAG: RtcB family protein [Desulfobacterales bacterium]|nr:RtcB family protein [Desulfobacterales bacterium]
MTADSRLNRIDKNKINITNPYNLDLTLFANKDVPVDSSSVDELIDLLKIKETIKIFDDISGNPEIINVALTPDFHKGKGVPVGTVLTTKGFFIPQAIGNDVNCGMRLHTTSLTKDQIKGDLDGLEKNFRHIFFEGGRNIPMSRVQREALFRNGITGLLDTTSGFNEGLWSLFHDLNIERELNNISQKGSLKADSTYGLDEFLGPEDRITRDGQIGSIGGGNHFVELQYVKNIVDGQIAHAWGLKKGMVVVMIHTGSLAIGHLSGNLFKDIVRRNYPNLKYPSNGVFPLMCSDENREDLNLFWDSLSNAGNFAFANRMFLSIMALESLQRKFGSIDFNLLYDAPHNFVWKKDVDGETTFVHRKGACPAGGLIDMKNTPFEYYGEPVIVPGSMGASSYLLAGLGNSESECSASHGAGRVLSRGKALNADEKEFKKFLENFRVVTPVDLRRQDIKLRKDIVKQTLSDIKKEAPFAYKGITPVIETLAGSGIANPVVELEPLMTIKG